MSSHADYLQRPYAFYIISAIENPAFSRPIIEANLVQRIPWNQPQCERHFSFLARPDEEHQYILIEDNFNDLELGIITNGIYYFNKKYAPDPSLPTAESIGIPGILHTQWDKPTLDELDALARKNNCLRILGNKTLYTLAELPDGNFDLTVTSVKRISEANLREPKEDKNFSSTIDKIPPLVYARDPVLGDVRIIMIATDSITDFEDICHKVESNRDRDPSQWAQSTNEVGLPIAAHTFQKRPSRDEVAEQKRLMGGFHRANKKLFN